ncbi:MAG: hypothetical protein NTZ60_06780 [Campylobacterales bacterium]|nr:hypothetical protein [Campylobacterales bacterium]
MKEYRKIVKTEAVLLKYDDVEKLINILIENIPNHSHAFDFNINKGDTTIGADNLNDLFAQDLPNEIDGLTCTVRGWTEDNNIDKGISLSFRRTVSDYQIHAYDETWFLGKIGQINTFLKSKKPWYAFLSKNFASINGILVVVFPMIFIFLINKEKYVLALFPVIVTIILMISFKKYLSGELFPQTRIILKEDNKQINYNFWLLLIGGLTLVATIVSTIKAFF